MNVFTLICEHKQEKSINMSLKYQYKFMTFLEQMAFLGKSHYK